MNVKKCGGVWYVVVEHVGFETAVREASGISGKPRYFKVGEIYAYVGVHH